MNRAIGWVCLVLAGCGGDDGLGAGLPDAGAGVGGCSTRPDNCAGETVCVASSCVAAFPRVYQLSGIQVTLPTTNQGAAWDVGGGAPDPLVKISVNGTVVSTTPAQQDTFTATFVGPYEVELIGGSTLLVDVFDEDVTTNDHAVGCSGTITAALARGRTLACGTTVKYIFAPK